MFTRGFPAYLPLTAAAICLSSMFAADNTPVPTSISTPELLNGPAVYGVKLTFSSKVAAAGVIPGGTVTFTLDGVPYTPHLVDLSGISSISTVLTTGTHSIGAHYDGNSSYLPSSTSSLNVIVDKAATVLTMASNPAH